MSPRSAHMCLDIGIVKGTLKIMACCVVAPLPSVQQVHGDLVKEEFQGERVQSYRLKACSR